jgi:hypothetical protein
MDLFGRRVLPLAFAAAFLADVGTASAEILFKGRLVGDGFHAYLHTDDSVEYTIDVYPIETDPSVPPLAVLQVSVSGPDGFWGCVLDFPPASVLRSGAEHDLTLNVDLSGLSPCEKASDLTGTVSLTARSKGMWRSRYVGTSHTWLGDVRILWNGIWEQTSAGLTGTIMGLDVASVHSDAAIHSGSNVWVTVERPSGESESRDQGAPVAAVAHVAGIVQYATSADRVVAHARALGGIHVSVPVVVIRPTAPLGDWKTPVAWVVPDAHRIFVLSTSTAYKRAEQGDARLLASALAHEQFHIDHGPDEGPAYEEQIRVLRKLGAPRGDIEAIAKVKSIVAQYARGEVADPSGAGPSSGPGEKGAREAGPAPAVRPRAPRR